MSVTGAASGPAAASFIFRWRYSPAELLRRALRKPVGPAPSARRRTRVRRPVGAAPAVGVWRQDDDVPRDRGSHLVEPILPAQPYMRGDRIRALDLVDGHGIRLQQVRRDPCVTERQLQSVIRKTDRVGILLAGRARIRPGVRERSDQLIRHAGCSLGGNVTCGHVPSRQLSRRTWSWRLVIPGRRNARCATSREDDRDESAQCDATTSAEPFLGRGDRRCRNITGFHCAVHGVAIIDSGAGDMPLPGGHGLVRRPDTGRPCPPRQR